MDVREKLVELLDEANSACVGTDCFEGCKFYMENDCMYKLMADVMIENGVTVQEWISVKDRLPEEEGLYLVAVVNDHERRYSKTAWYHGHGNWFLHQKVTHWQYLPQPPKGE